MSPNPHLWEIRWVRDLFLLLVAALLVMATYSARAVVAPVLVGLALAYVFNPLVTFGSTKWRVPRWASTLILMLLGFMAVGCLILFIVPGLIRQVQLLISATPGYIETIGNILHIDWEQAKKVATQTIVPTGAVDATAGAARPDVDLKSIGSLLAIVLGYGLNLLNFTINLTVYLCLVAVVVAFCFFYFTWKFEQITSWFAQFIPQTKQQRTLEVLDRMDRTVSAFVRGRLVQALVMALVLSVGWRICNVPYWLLLGVLSGILNLVPFIAAVGWLIAVILAVIDQMSSDGAAAAVAVPVAAWGFSIWVLVMPTVVYLLAQAFDGWVVEPLVQGKATDLNPLTVLLAVLIGGALAGLLGLIVAIPVAACVKILSQEIILPRLRALVQGTST